MAFAMAWGMGIRQDEGGIMPNGGHPRVEAEEAEEFYRAQAKRLRSNIARLLGLIGDLGKCRGCGTDIYWVRHKSGKKAPYTIEGLNHFADCPAKDKFRKGK